MLRRKALRQQSLVERGAGVVQQQRAVERHGVAAEFFRVGLVRGDALLRRDTAFDRRARFRVEGGGVIEQGAARQWTEAGVEVVEAGIDQSQRDGFKAENLFHHRGHRRIRTEAVTLPHQAARLVEQRVARALEAQAFRRRHHFESRLLEPCRKPRFLAAAWRATEAAEQRAPARWQCRRWR